jgi:hypothetical protein
MKKFQGPKYFTLVCVAALFAAPAFAQDAAAPKKDEKAAGGQPDEAAMMAAMMELAKPGENHKILQAMVGAWTYKVKFWVTPDAPPMESSGTTMTRPAMGGRYFISDHKGMMQMPGPDGAMQNMEFNGMAVEGYDNVKKKFVSSWIDNMGTGIMNSEGTFDSSAHALTYVSEYEPMPGMKTKVRQLITITDQNHHKMEFFEMRGDKEVKTMEIDYTRSGVTPGAATLRVPSQNKIKSTTGE